MRNDLGVGFRVELTRFGQFLAEFQKVFDNAVMDNAHAARKMRVRIGLIRNAMCRPARMRNSGLTIYIGRIEFGFEVLDLPLGAFALQAAICQHGYAGTVIAPIFKPFQPINESVRDRFPACNSNNATHSRALIFTECQFQLFLSQNSMVFLKPIQGENLIISRHKKSRPRKEAARSFISGKIMRPKRIC